ncbi:ABC transporter ATP-binding protein [Tissierella praeacuta]|uniref:ABC transporter ATP-binding protein n=1 Tax=Tissierella praeacuta TaxID=43131 RepID=UPI00333E9A4E
MIGVFKKIWDFAGSEQKNIRNSIILGFINAIFHAAQLSALFVILNSLVTGNSDSSKALASFGVMLLSVVGKIVTQYISQLQRTHAGYFMVAEKRVYIGNKLKLIPMGYFNQNSLGNITAVATTILSDVENAAPVVLVTSLGGFLTSLVFSIALMIFDWRIGLIVLVGMFLFLCVVSLMEKKSRRDVPKRQAAQATLVETVLETIQGMSVVKAFNLDFNKGKKVDNAIDESCRKNRVLEKAMNPYVAIQQIILYLFSVLIIFASIYFYLNGSLSLVYCLMMMIASFMVYEQLKIAGSCMANLRITENSINHANEIDDVPVMDEKGWDIIPKTHDIRFDNVTFSYENKPVLKSVSLTIPDKSLTAIVGPSGSGKTTLCNLIARFWDVNGGKVSIGGYDVKDYTLDSLLSNVSMVFQNVYLFDDTIENNIKFGKPDATHKEVVEAARKACCDEFIKALPDGYNTVIGEGGASLSGGEKQRLSIARAMLKDTPIVIFDETTANIDPENEDRLQSAIEALTKDKTIIMIAHRLKTVRNADQIVVLDKGQIVQKGTHDGLMKEKGIYADFIGVRKQAIGWKL